MGEFFGGLFVGVVIMFLVAVLPAILSIPVEVCERRVDHDTSVVTCQAINHKKVFFNYGYTPIDVENRQ